MRSPHQLVTAESLPSPSTIYLFSFEPELSRNLFLFRLNCRRPTNFPAPESGAPNCFAAFSFPRISVCSEGSFYSFAPPSRYSLRFQRLATCRSSGPWMAGTQSLSFFALEEDNPPLPPPPECCHTCRDTRSSHLCNPPPGFTYPYSLGFPNV